MNLLTRSTFIKQSFKTGAFLTWAALTDWEEVIAGTKKHHHYFPQSLLKQMIAANDKAVAALLKVDVFSQRFTRSIGSNFSKLSAAYVSLDSNYHHAAELLPVLENTALFLQQNQGPDGTFNLANLESPPDTAFLVELLTAGAYLLKKDAAPPLDKVNTTVKSILLKAGEAIATGGVHTPNHRWVICAALARLNHLYPNKKYLARIDEWMGEGIFNDADGHYPERSMNYGYVENNSLITMARLLNKTALLEPVRKNLHLTWYCSEPNGDLVTVESRRQDQYMRKGLVEFYLHYRYMAIRDGNSLFAGIAQFIETLSLSGTEEHNPYDSLYLVLENELLLKDLPTATPPPVDFEKLFATSSLLRIRRNDTTLTFFGGNDQPIIIASGRSNSPNFFSYRKGKAILNYLRLSTKFFNTGYFYSDGLKKMGTSYVLHQTVQAPYYQPLPKNFQNKAGDYKLSPSTDGRFWNKMDFANRPVSNVKTLQTTVTLTETTGAAALRFEVTGLPEVEVTIELCFKSGGKLSGVTKAENDNYFLEEGTGKYEMDDNSISFGPGIAKHRNITGLEGERYSTHFGTLRTEGIHVYLTGVTPFSHTLQFS